MPTVQRWGRNESLIWPPRTYLYTLSAFFLSLAATGLFVYVHFQFGFSPLERYYLPYYLRSEMPSLTHHASTYQLLYVSDGNSRARPALAADVRSGQTAQPTGAPLPLALSAQARQQGFRLLFREQPRNYPNQTFHAWLAQWIYDDVLSTGSSIHNSCLVSRRSCCNSRFPSARTSSGANNCGMEDG